MLTSDRAVVRFAASLSCSCEGARMFKTLNRYLITESPSSSAGSVAASISVDLRSSTKR
jgi:hypothetical protein